MFITELNSNPSLLFDITVRIHVVWIILAWISFVANAAWIIIQFIGNNKDIDYIPASFLHLIWIVVSLLWHVIGLISPFLFKASIIKYEF